MGKSKCLLSLLLLLCFFFRSKEVKKILVNPLLRFVVCHTVTQLNQLNDDEISFLMPFDIRYIYVQTSGAEVLLLLDYGVAQGLHCPSDGRLNVL